MPNVDSQSRNQSLDGLRGLAIIAVVIHHGTLTSSDLTSWFREWNSVISLGFFGGQLFLTLSGYFMTVTLLKARRDSRSIGSIYATRMIRLAPLYWIVFVLTCLVQPFAYQFLTGRSAGNFIPQWDSAALYAFFSANISIALHGFQSPFDVTWTLAVQEQFYLLWIPAIYFLPRSWHVRLGVLVLLVSILGRPIAFAIGISPTTIHVLTPFRMDAIAVGGLVAIAQLSGWVPSKMTGIGTLVASLAFLIVLTLFPHQGSTWHPVVGYTAMDVLSYLWLASMLIVPSTSFAGRLLSIPALRWYGRHSYAIYLLHMPTFSGLYAVYWFLIARHSPENSTAMARVAIGFFNVVACIPIAWLAWRIVERPMEKCKDRLRKRAELPVYCPAPDTKKIASSERPTQIDVTPVSAPQTVASSR